MIIVLTLLLSTVIKAQTTLLDPSFDGDGKVTAAVGSIPLSNKINDAVLQPDGKIIVVGRAGGNGGFPENYQIAVARFNPDGSLDNTFDSDGKLITVPDSSRICEAFGVALQTDGKIVIIGNVGSAASNNLDGIIIRYNTDGSLDNTFDNDGIKFLNFDVQDGYDSLNDVVIQPNGKIVFAGDTVISGTVGVVVGRLNSDGSFDTTFGTNGYKLVSGGLNLPKIALYPDNKIILTGDVNQVYSLVKFNSDGSLDQSFGTNGIVQNAGGRDLALQSDGKIVTTKNSEIPAGWKVNRYNSNGTADNSFDGDGLATIVFPNTRGNIAHSFGLAIDANNKIVVVGEISILDNPTIYDFGVARLNTNGSLDSSFGLAGKVVTDINGDDKARKVIVQPDGKIVAVGESNGGFTLVRYIPGQILNTCRPVSDFDGDGKSDLALYNNNGTWNFILSQTNNLGGIAWGSANDRLAPADFDGDCRTDAVVFRNGIWYIRTLAGSNSYLYFGQTGDTPVPADYDGDGLADAAVYRNGTWYVQRSRDGFFAIQFGLPTDKPVPADYDGDGKTDVAVYRNGVWYLMQSTAGFAAVQWGVASDRPVVGDYDGDGKADIAVFRPANSTWYLLRSSQGMSGTQWGISTDTPVPADYDGDGKTDIAVYRNGDWYLLQSTAGLRIANFSSGTVPIQSVYVP